MLCTAEGARRKSERTTKKTPPVLCYDDGKGRGREQLKRHCGTEETERGRSTAEEGGGGKRLVALDGAEDEVLALLGNTEDAHLQMEEQSVLIREGGRRERRTVLVDPPPARHPWRATMVSFLRTIPSSRPFERP